LFRRELYAEDCADSSQEPAIRQQLRAARAAEKHAKMKAALAEKQQKEAEETTRREQQQAHKTAHRDRIDVWKNKNKVRCGWWGVGRASMSLQLLCLCAFRLITLRQTNNMAWGLGKVVAVVE
jgi:hypothetical protein